MECLWLLVLQTCLIQCTIGKSLVDALQLQMIGVASYNQWQVVTITIVYVK